MERPGLTSGQVAGIVIFVLGLVALGVMFLTLSPLVDKMVGLHNKQVNQGMVISSEKSEVMGMLNLIIGNWPVIAFVLLIFSAILVSLRERSGAV